MSEFSTLAPRLHKAHHQTQMQMIADEVARQKHLEEFTHLDRMVEHCALQMNKAFYNDDIRCRHKWLLLLEEARQARKRLLKKGPVIRDLFA